MEDKEHIPSQTWLLRYIVTAETAALIMMIGFFATGYQDLVTKMELEKIPYPYLKEQSIVRKHISDSERTLERVSETVHSLNTRIIQENHAQQLAIKAQELRITILEEDLKLRRNGILNGH